jgi:2-C-methyl-D-erythritol 4-phosphate cytidylyltransferase
VIRTLGRGHRPTGQAALVVLAGGSGSRVGAGMNKVYLPLAGRRLVSWSFTWAAEVAELGHFVLVVRPEDADLAHDLLRRECAGLPVQVVVGGGTRHESEQAAIERLAPAIEQGDVDVVAIHDGARPLTGPALFRAVVTTAASIGGAVPALAADGVLPVAPDGVLGGVLGGTAAGGGGPGGGGLGLGGGLGGAAAGGGGPGGGGGRSLARVQTPQAFRAKDLHAAYAAAAADGYQGTDTACTLEGYSDLVVQVVAGSRQNLKVTYPHDLLLAERLLAAHQYRMP